MEQLPPGHDMKSSKETVEDRSHIYMGVVLGVIILIMGYLTLFVDDPWRFFREKNNTVALSTDRSDLLDENRGMSDEEVRKSLIKFIEAFYDDQRRGYFDPPSYFAPITETFYNYHSLTHQRLKEQFWKRRNDMENLKYNWIPSSLEFRRDSSRIIATYWVAENYYRLSKHAQQSADVRLELIINDNGKILSFKELEVKNFESYGFSGTASDSIVSDSVAIRPNIPEETPTPVTTDAIPEPEVKDQKIYELGAVDSPPEFPGGQKELVKFLNRSLRYPNSARQNETEGKVFVGFIIEKNGGISDVKVLRGIGSGCDEEALRVIHLLPAWKPATSGGKLVRNAYVLSVTFKLN